VAYGNNDEITINRDYYCISDVRAGVHNDMMNQRVENEIAADIVEAAFRIHRTIGPGLLESAYQKMMVVELRHMGREVEVEVVVPVVWRGEMISPAFRIDLLVDGKVVVELKSVESISPLHISQVVTYLKLTNHALGLLINFNSELLKDGIKRVAHRMRPSDR
jgi:GxxExxY protein